ncbi:hypothetical protein BDP55DRAFT_638154 [Colletotrichum godetiae]|uniref:Uncharacterized protein n=1 Tax=Colletotrichum godetiae TaxID=1209918 RepID=A0AAJ0A7R0_9PEZI|nr:uncharacterized protein BDP55DRAFT_638154 [Colletotrichum godetiae]KAK1658047.1 hypothetical protein BDP55DRAFT_638154 [Colletotrichum godetiae]
MDDRSLVPCSEVRSPANWAPDSVLPLRYPDPFPSQPQSFPSQHGSNQHGSFSFDRTISDGFETGSLDLAGDIVLSNYTDPLQFDELVVDPSLLSHSGTGEGDEVATEPHQDGRYHSARSSARASQNGSTRPSSNSLWADGSNRRSYQNSRFLAAPMQTPTSKPPRKRRRRRNGNEGSAYTEVIEADEAPRWGWDQRPPEQAREAPCNDDNIGLGRFDDTTQSCVSPSDAGVAVNSLLDFLGQPQAGRMIASDDFEAVVRIWSFIRRMQ